jgi:hypothetical protein
MYRPPFHRQVYPWVFITLFFTLAPVLIFYTSGYRYNAKKGQIERNGTLIVDTTPRAASIFIDSQQMADVTPHTFQNIAPGLHRLRLERPGYHTWEKTLEVRPEQVTFAHLVELWRDANPSLVQVGPFTKVRRRSASSLLLIATDSSSTRLLTWPGTAPSLVLTTSTWSYPPSLRTPTGGGATLIGGEDAEQPTWILPSTGSALQTLPYGRYWWSDQDLVGAEQNSQFSYDLTSNRLTREPLPPGVLATDGDLSLRVPTSSATNIRQLHVGSRAVQLPSGNWTLYERRDGNLVLNDGRRWLWCHLQTPISCQIAEGLEVSWESTRSDALGLVYDENSVWLWQPGIRPLLLWRQSDPIRNALWSANGRSIFIASQHAVFSLELDNRNGYLMTPLATFDEIHDLERLGPTLYIAATQGDTHGLWSLPIE